MLRNKLLTRGVPGAKCPSTRSSSLVRAGTITVLAAGVCIVHGIEISLNPAAAATVLAIGYAALKNYFASSPDSVVAELGLNVNASRGGALVAVSPTGYLLAGYGPGSFQAYAPSTNPQTTQ